MKKITNVFLCLLFLSSFVYAQNFEPPPDLSLRSDKQSLDSMVIEQFNEGMNAWVRERLYAFTYDSEGRVATYIWEAWDPYLQQLDYKLKREYSYNDLGQKDLTFGYGWFDNAWKLGGRTSHIYDAGGKLLEELSESWQEDLQMWLPLLKKVITYNAQGLMGEDNRFQWNSTQNDWKPIRRYIYTYTSEGLLNEYVRLDWYFGDTSWTNSYKYVYSYDPAGRLIETIYFRHDQQGGWREDSKYLYTYGSNGKKDKSLWYKWGSEDWSLNGKTELAYDSYGNPVADTMYLWNSFNSIYTPYSRSELVIDLNFSLDDLILPLPDYYIPEITSPSSGEPFVHQPLIFKSYLMSGGLWVDDSRFTYFYSPFTTSTRRQQTVELLLFPNPTSEQLTIVGLQGLAQLHLYDTQGRQILFRELSGTTPLNLGHLPPGWYVYQITQEGQIYSGKILIQR